MFGKLRKLLGANSPAPQQKVTAQAQRLQPKQAIGRGPSSMSPQQVAAYNATQPYTQDNVRTNSLVDAGQLPEWRREGSLRVEQFPARGFKRTPQGVFANGVQWPQDTQEDDPRLPDMMPLTVRQNRGQQTMGRRVQEDEVMPNHEIQPVNYNNGQVTLSARLMQGRDGNFENRFNRLRY